jgi:ATP-dependent DNA helicase RecQ
MYFKLVQDSLAAGRPPEKLPARPTNTLHADFACWRFLSAWAASGSLTPDHAVLLRQVVRWSPMRIHLDGPPQFAQDPEGGPDPFATADLRMSHLGELEAVPFAPEWLFAEERTAVAEIDGPPERRRPDESIPAEPFLATRSSNPSWYSQAQKEAAWAVLDAPPRSTTLVALPTGGGKSLCFQLLPLFGSGLTVVVVPTVALAIDQAAAALEVFAPPVLAAIRPSYYASDDQAEQTLELVEHAQTRLLFTSPEACVSGRLHRLLEEAAEDGRLENLVVDEAHLVATWGMHFRVEFQLLSMLRRRWLAAHASRLRTFLFSATYSEQASGVLRSSFSGPGGEWRQVVSQRLRPEPTYYLRCFTEDPAGAKLSEGLPERDRRVLECIWRLPRPAILYATEVDEAKAYAALLGAQGFRRIGCFHGETPGADRRDLIRRWRRDEIDLMVATSAFGLGVDKQDVRAVVHACLPENIDRYYQEVGRGGRDGGSSVCVLLPSSRDFDVARTLGPKLLRPETVQRRWDALWSSPTTIDPDAHVYEVCVNARPDNLLGARTYSEHIRWNKRLLLQLQRAGALELQSMRYEHPLDGETEGAEYVEVKLAFPPAAGDLAERVSAPRRLELEAMQDGYQQMVRYTGRDAECIARTLATVYGRTVTKRVCGGCPACRRAVKPPFDYCPDLPLDSHPETTPKLVVVTGGPRRASPGALDSWTIAFRRLLDRGVQRFVCRSADRDWLASVLDRADAQRRWWYRIDPTDAEAPDFWPDEVVIVLHLGRVDERALGLRHGRRVDHVIEDRVPITDAHGRYPLESSGASLQPFERWDLVH